MANGAAPTFGLWYDFRQRPPLGDYVRFYAECLREIEEAEGLGFAEVWLSEHHFVDDGYLPSPLAAAAAIAVAARTERMTVGTKVLLLPMYHPLRVAEGAAVADLISGERFVLGVRQGYVQLEFEVLGFDRRYRPSLFEEGIEVIKRAWEEGYTGYEGKRWRFEDLPFEPRPEKRPPIYIGAFADPTIDRAARLADGFLASTGGVALANTYRRVREALVRHGRADEDFPFVASGVVHGHEDLERVCVDVAPAISYQRSRYAEWSTDRDRPKPAPVRAEDLPWERHLVGGPEEVAQGLIELHRQAPYDHFYFWGRLPSITHEWSLASTRLFASEAMPRVRDAAGS